VLSIARNHPGVSDIEVIAIAATKNGFIITEDKDFGDVLIYQSPDICVPALLLRLQQTPLPTRANLVFQVLQNHSIALLQSFAVLTPQKLRIRKFGSIL
jgi:predicted nuclease of predicted toxin-antitoxin system